MRRDEELLQKLLLHAEGEDPKPDLSSYSLEQQAYHAAILIDSGLVAGEALRDLNGEVRGAAIVDLTPAGHDFLKTMRSNFVPSSKTQTADIEIFISHSKLDEDLAGALIDLLMEALGISRTKIRCTSVVGHKLSGGTPIETRLREEINSSKIFLGLLTPSSLESTYVMFELGARWGIDKYWCLLRARGADVGDLKGPLPAYHVPDASSQSDLAQMIEDFGTELGKVPQNYAVVQEKINAVIRVANLIAKENGSTPASKQSVDCDETDSITHLTGWVGNNIASLSNRVITFSKLDAQLGLPSGASEKHLENIAIQAGAKLIRRGKGTILFESPDEEYPFDVVERY